MDNYIVLNKKAFKYKNFSLVPIRFDDRYDIMKWRNEQIYHLRQNKPLTTADQDFYFENVVSKLFDQIEPNQILFSLLKDNICIGYGGLVHINWIDRNAEVSFIMDTQLESLYFKEIWQIYLRMIKEVSFSELKLNKIFVYAFDLRPHLYEVLEQSGYFLDARLKNHCFYNNNLIDVVIYSILNE
jgi:hypothetical protein